jgi:predicted esterase
MHEIDPSRIAEMGFSKGGLVALYASLTRFQRVYGSKGLEFAAYIPFYAPCNTIYREDELVSDRPIRLFHGTGVFTCPLNRAGSMSSGFFEREKCETNGVRRSATCLRQSGVLTGLFQA